MAAPDYELLGWCVAKAVQQFGAERVSQGLKNLVDYFGRRPSDD